MKISYYRNGTDPTPVTTDFNPAFTWIEGASTLLSTGRAPSLLTPTGIARYGNPSPDGLSRGMQGWGWEAGGGAAASIVRALKGEGATYQDFYDFLAEHGTGPEGFPIEAYERFVGRRNPDVAPGGERPGMAQWNPIWLRATDPLVGANRYHADTWQDRGTWYGLDDKSRPRPIILQPLGTGESGGESVPTTEKTLSVQGRLELIERQLAELLAMLRKGNP